MEESLRMLAETPPGTYLNRKDGDKQSDTDTDGRLVLKWIWNLLKDSNVHSSDDESIVGCIHMLFDVGIAHGMN